MFTIYMDNDVNSSEYTQSPIHDPSRFDEGYIASGITYTKELNKAGSCKFTIPLTNPAYNDIFELGTTLIIRMEGRLVWLGRVLNIDTDYYGNKTISGEGALGFLNDIYVKPFYYNGVTPGVDLNTHITEILRQYNSKCSAKRSFPSSTIQTPEDFHDSDVIKVYGVEAYETVIDCLASAISYDGQLSMMVNYTGGMNFSLNISKTPYFTCTSPIEVCVNLIDLNDTLDGSDIYTALIPLDNDNRGLEGNHYCVLGQSLVSRYGRIERTVTLDGYDMTQTSNIENLCQGVFTEEAKMIVPKITVTALDLNPIDFSGNSMYDVGFAIQIICPPLGINDWYICETMTYNVNDPENSTYTFAPITNDSFVPPNNQRAIKASKSALRTSANPSYPDATKDNNCYVMSGTLTDILKETNDRINKKALEVHRHPDRITYTDTDLSYTFPNPSSGETFDTYKEDWLDDNVVVKTQTYGVGVLNKGTANEQVTRLVFPDMTYVSLINF